MKVVYRTIFVLLITAVAYCVVDIGRYFVYPDFSCLKTTNPQKTAFMKQREKAWEKKGVKRKITNVYVPLSRISPYVVKAVIIAEDDKFWSHQGFDLDAMQKALEKDIEKKKFKAGGSTISQQLAKNLYLSPSRNPVRKIKEAILTWRLERHLSKRRIMELYLNVAEWGDGIFGIEAAARRHFGKSAVALSPREAAVLASILPSPRRYRTDGTSRYVENRADQIYQIMVRRGIVIEEYEDVISLNGENLQEAASQEAAVDAGDDAPTDEDDRLRHEENETVQEGRVVNPALPER